MRCAPIRAVELQPRASRPARIEPQAHHVFDPEGACQLLVKTGPAELNRRKEVRVQPCAVGRRQRVCMPMPPAGRADLARHLAARLACPDHDVARTDSLVVGDDVAGDEAAERVQDGLRERDRPFDVSRLA